MIINSNRSLNYGYNMMTFLTSLKPIPYFIKEKSFKLC